MKWERDRTRFEVRFCGQTSILVAASPPGGFVSQVLWRDVGAWCILDSVVTEGMDDVDALADLNRLELDGRTVAEEGVYVCWTPDPLDKDYAFLHTFCDLGFV